MKRDCFLYARISRTTQATSLMNQTNFKSDNFNVLNTFYDDGVSARASAIFKRKGFLKMISRLGIEAKKIDEKIIFVRNGLEPECSLLITSHTSRLMRDLKLHLDLLEALHSVGVEVIYLDLNKSSKEDVGLLLNMVFTMDDFESRNISTKVKTGLIKSQQKQYLHGANKLYGFDYSKKDNALSYNEDSAIVYNMFKLYKEGKSFMEIQLIYPHLQNNHIKRILSNIRYTGHDYYNMYDSNRKLRSINENELFVSPRIPPIVSLELFKEVQAIRLKKNNNKGLEKRKNGYSLTSKITCECGKNYIRKDAWKGFSLWQCQNARIKKCDSRILNEKIILDYLKHERGLNGIKFRFKALLNERHENIRFNSKTSLKLTLDELEAKRKRIVNVYLGGHMEDDEYYPMIEEVEKELEKYSFEIEQQRNKEKVLRELDELEKTFMHQMKELKDILYSEAPEDIFNKIINIKTYLDSNNKPQVDYITFKGFEAIEEMKLYDVKRLRE